MPITLETGKIYRPITSNGKTRFPAIFLIRFLGLDVREGQCDIRAQFLELDGKPMLPVPDIAFALDKIGTAPGLIHDLEPYTPKLDPQVAHLLECSIESINFELTCDFCGNEGSADIDDHEARSEKAQSFYDQGWRNAYSKEYQVQGIACPGCMAGESDDVSGLVEQN